MYVLNHFKEVVPWSVQHSWRQNDPEEWEDDCVEPESQFSKDDCSWVIFFAVLNCFHCVDHSEHGSGNAPICEEVPHVHDSIGVEPEGH